jgi:protein phosphatase PTC2/3
LTLDHKPSEDSEMKRIIKGGGHLYQNGVPLGYLVPDTT